ELVIQEFHLPRHHFHLSHNPEILIRSSQLKLSSHRTRGDIVFEKKVVAIRAKREIKQNVLLLRTRSPLPTPTLAERENAAFPVPRVAVDRLMNEKVAPQKRSV